MLADQRVVQHVVVGGHRPDDDRVAVVADAAQRVDRADRLGAQHRGGDVDGLVDDVQGVGGRPQRHSGGGVQQHVGGAQAVHVVGEGDQACRPVISG